MSKLHPIIAAVGIAGFGLAAQAQTQAAPGSQVADKGYATTVRNGVPQTARDFMKEAAQANQGEIAAADLALERASDPAVKEYARQMISDHTRANAQLKDLAQKMKVALPDEPSVMYRSKLRLLRATQPQAFDSQYMDDFGVQAHRSTVDQFRMQLQNGQQPEVQAFVRRTLPTLEQHLQRAQELHAGIESRHPQGMSGRPGAMAASGVAGAGSRTATQTDRQEETRQARSELDEAVQVVQRMKADPGVTDMLRRAKGVFIMPDYGRAALGIGVQGGQGVLVARQGDHFSNPVFYNMGGLSIGVQAGAAAGQIAMLLMTDKAVQDFRSGKNFSINADAGLNIVNYAARKQASAGKIQDMIVWSGASGAYAGASIGLNDVTFDEEANRAYYGKDNLNPARIIDGGVQTPGNNVLGMVLAV
jgi:lipid-binding SYLF domain-containing protein/predicted outer membrane protein